MSTLEDPYPSRRQLMKAVPASVLGFSLAACDLLGLSWRYRYRLAAEVVRHGRLYSGSSVIEVIRTKGYDGIGGEAHGEAVAIDMPGAQTLFLLLRSPFDGVDWPFSMPHWAFAKQLGGPKMADADQINQLTNMAGQSAVLARDQYPLMIRFRDPRDIRTIAIVDPDNLAASFGAGTELRRVTLQITRDRTTHSVASKLPPSGKGSGFAEWSRGLAYEDPRRVDLEDFIR